MINIIYGLIAICLSLAIPYEEFLYYIKNFVWMTGWVLIGLSITTSPTSAIIGVALMLVAFFFKTQYPLIFVSLFVGALGSILLGGVL